MQYNRIEWNLYSAQFADDSNRGKILLFFNLIKIYSSQVESHLKECTTTSTTTTNKATTNTTTNTNMTDKPPLACPYCPFVFHKHSIRNLHMEAHVDNFFECVVCFEVYSDWRPLRKHFHLKHPHLLNQDSSIRYLFGFELYSLSLVV